MGAATESEEFSPLINNISQSRRRGWLYGCSDNGGIKPWHNDDRAWVQWLMDLLRLMWRMLVGNHVNAMLLFVPIGIVLGVLGDHPAAFITNVLAIVPLAALLSFATEELSVKLGQTIGGLTKAIFRNAVELIVSTSSTTKRESF
jgi:Ca2+:H+ antiporter